MKTLPDKNLLAVLAVWAAVWALVAATLPLLPIDETRYLTVAWEMRLQDSWILPTLNFAPYSHKPPLLFWLINAVWTVTGPAVWSARLVPFAVSTALLFCTFSFARRLFPDRENMPAAAALTLAASPFFYLYGGLIMFDMMNSLIALVAVWFTWRAGKERKYRWLLGWGIATGIGVLAKGPVILIYTIFPALLAPLWHRDVAPVKWYGALLAGLAAAVVIGLLWALPAAHLGGDEYARMIFWKQTAGRMANAFDHQRSALFYLPVLPLMFLPLMLWPAWWRAMGSGARALTATGAGRFILCWVVPPFISLLLISGKQVHYLIPLVPGLALFFAAAMERYLPEKPSLKIPFAAFGAALLLMLAAPFAGPHLGFIQENKFFLYAVSNMHPLYTVAALALTGLLYYAARRGKGKQRLLGLTLLVALFFAHFQAQASKHNFEYYYDLRPLAAAMDEYKDRPLAWVRNYEGEIGFLARMEKPLDSLYARGQLRGWFAAHPDGVAVIRGREEDIKGYRILFRMPYRSAEKIIALVEEEK